MAWYERTRDYEVKHYEESVIYFLAFCMFAAIVTEKIRFFIASFIICTLELFWNMIIIFFMVHIYKEISTPDNNRPANNFLIQLNNTVYIFIRRMIDQEYYRLIFLTIKGNK